MKKMILLTILAGTSLATAGTGNVGSVEVKTVNPVTCEYIEGSDASIFDTTKFEASNLMQVPPGFNAPDNRAYTGELTTPRGQKISILVSGSGYPDEVPKISLSIIAEDSSGAFKGMARGLLKTELRVGSGENYLKVNCPAEERNAQ